MDKFIQYIDSIGQTELARKMGVSRSAVWNWRHGRACPDWHMAKRIAEESGGVLKPEEIRPDIYE